MPTYRGLAVNWGIGSSITGISASMQTRDHAYRSEAEMIRNGQGSTTAAVFYDPSEEATFNWVAIAGLASSGSATVTVPTIGEFVTVVDTQYPAVSGSTWIARDVSTAGSNTAAVRVTVKAERYPNITS